MSLIYFHIFLISTGILFSLGFSVWEFVNYQINHAAFDFIVATLSGCFTIGLFIYLIWFIKTKKSQMKG